MTNVFSSIFRSLSRRVALTSFTSIILAVATVTIVPDGAFAGAGVENDLRWPSRTIHYVICDCSAGNPKPLCTTAQCVGDPDTVRKAIALWNEQAGSVIKLVPREANDKKNPYLLYVSQLSETSKEKYDKDARCFTEEAGYSKANEPKYIVLQDGCIDTRKKSGTHLRVILHETGHAVGLHHEQQRTDRDKYLIVQFTGSTANTEITQSGRMCAPHQQENCEFQSFYATRLYTYGQDLADYDPASVMHYALKPQNTTDPIAWKKTCEDGHENDLETACIGLKRAGIDRMKEQGLLTQDIGRTKGLSSSDIKSLDQLYQGISF